MTRDAHDILDSKAERWVVAIPDSAGVSQAEVARPEDVVRDLVTRGLYTDETLRAHGYGRGPQGRLRCIAASTVILVALCIARHMGAQSVAWPSVAAMARWTQLGETAIREALRVLCTGPLALFDRRAGLKGMAPNRYSLRNPLPSAALGPNLFHLGVHVGIAERPRRTR